VRNTRATCLAAAIALALVNPLTVAEAAAQSTARDFRVEAGSLGQALKFGFGAEAVHTSKYFIHENGDPNLFQDAFWRLNANARIGGADDRWELELIGRNLTNEYIKVVGLDKTFGKPGTYTVYSLRPREIVLQGTVRF